MPSFDRVVTIGPPTKATYTATLAALEAPAHQINDGDPVANIDLPGEFAFANAQGLIQWFSPAPFTINRQRFADATDAVIVPPAAQAGEAVVGGVLPNADTFLGGHVRLYVAIGASTAPGLLLSFALDDVMVDDGVHTFGLSDYAWHYAAESVSDLTPFSNTRYTAEFDFVVRTRKAWAMLLDGGSYDTIVGEATAATTQTRRYRMRYAEVDTFQDLNDGDEAWNIVGVELEGRRRTMLVDVQRTLTAAERQVELT